MENKNILTGVVMIETIWETRNKGLLDLIASFINYAISKMYSPNEKIIISEVINYVKSEFGYDELPESVVIKVLRKNKTNYKRKNDDYYLVKDLDNESREFDNRKIEIEKIIKEISSDLSNYLNENCTKKENYSLDDSINALNCFFAKYGICVGANTLLSNIPNKSNEENYFVAKYIIEAKEKNKIEYKYILNLVEGYLIKCALYLQLDSSSSLMDYSKVLFIYDTPFLLDLLGYQTNRKEENANELHKMLKNKGAKFGFFYNIEEELNSILCAYKNSLGKINESTYTLEKLDELGYNTNDVERLIDTWTSKLSLNFDVERIKTPNFNDKNNTIVNLESKELDISSFISAKTNGIYAKNKLERDLKSLFYVNRIRNNLFSREIEKCKCIFVTTNNALVNYFSEYYKNNIDEKSYRLVISDFELSSLVWLKTNQGINIPELQLLKNAYSAISPSPELLSKFAKVYKKMEIEGNLSEEAAILLRTRKFIYNEIQDKNITSPEQIDDNMMKSIVDGIEEKGYKAAMLDNELKKEKEKTKQLEDMTKAAINCSNKVYKIVYNSLKFILCIIIFFLAIEIISCSIEYNDSINLLKNIIIILFIIFTTFDAFISHKYLLHKIIHKSATQMKNAYYNKKIEEYKKFIKE